MGIKQFLERMFPRDDYAALAEDAVVRAFPSHKVYDTSLRATEGHRRVYAVFYDDPENQLRPTPYCLVSVPTSDPTYRSADVQILEGALAEPYWYRNTGSRSEHRLTRRRRRRQLT